MYKTALESASKYHFFRPETPENQYIIFAGALEAGPPSLRTEVQHLGCFVGGMVALGARIDTSPEELKIAI